jgi:glycerate 2-kinase
LEREAASRGGRESAVTAKVENLIIGNLAAAVDAAGVEAERRGYSHAMHCATGPEGEAEEVGRRLAEITLRMRAEAGPDCLITGGEPTVTLAPKEQRGLGGRNQQLALAALQSIVSGSSQRREIRSRALRSSPAGPTARTAPPTRPGP